MQTRLIFLVLLFASCQSNYKPSREQLSGVWSYDYRTDPNNNWIFIDFLVRLKESNSREEIENIFPYPLDSSKRKVCDFSKFRIDIVFKHNNGYNIQIFSKMNKPIFSDSGKWKFGKDIHGDDVIHMFGDKQMKNSPKLYLISNFGGVEIRFSSQNKFNIFSEDFAVGFIKSM